MSDRKKVKLYSDGSARGNPDGPGGYGTILQYTDASGKLHEREYSEGFVKTTNNRMELMGVITGLEALRMPCEVDVYTDSQYIVKAFNEHWIESWIKKGWKLSDGQPVANQDLWKLLLIVMNKHDVTFHKVKGHADDPLNNRCDELARAAIRDYRQRNADLFPEEDPTP